MITSEDELQAVYKKLDEFTEPKKDFLLINRERYSYDKLFGEDKPGYIIEELLKTKDIVEKYGRNDCLMLFSRMGKKLPYAQRINKIKVFEQFYLENGPESFGKDSTMKELTFQLSSKPTDIIRLSSSRHFTSCFSLEDGEQNGALVGELMNPYSTIAIVDEKNQEHDSIVCRALIYFIPGFKGLTCVVNPSYYSRQFRMSGKLEDFYAKIFTTLKDFCTNIVFEPPREFFNRNVLNAFIIPKDAYVKPDKVDHLNMNKQNVFDKNWQFCG